MRDEILIHTSEWVGIGSHGGGVGCRVGGGPAETEDSAGCGRALGRGREVEARVCRSWLLLPLPPLLLSPL